MDVIEDAPFRVGSEVFTREYFEEKKEGGGCPLRKIFVIPRV